MASQAACDGAFHGVVYYVVSIVGFVQLRGDRLHCNKGDWVVVSCDDGRPRGSHPPLLVCNGFPVDPSTGALSGAVRKPSALMAAWAAWAITSCATTPRHGLAARAVSVRVEVHLLWLRTLPLRGMGPRLLTGVLYFALLGPRGLASSSAQRGWVALLRG